MAWLMPRFQKPGEAVPGTAAADSRRSAAAPADSDEDEAAASSAARSSSSRAVTVSGGAGSSTVSVPVSLRVTISASAAHCAHCFDILHAHFRRSPSPAPEFDITIEAPFFVTLKKVARGKRQ